MSCLTKDEILKRGDAKKWERVDVPEWGGHVNVRVMTARERDGLEHRFKNSNVGYRAYLVAMLSCDDKGEDLFASGDIPALEEKSATAMTRVVKVAMRLNGMTEESIEEAEKNSEAIQ
jgi:hypothetical protein